MPERLRPSFELLEKALSDVYEGRLPPQRASAMASLTGAMVKVINAGKADAYSPIPAQMIFPDVDKWYAMIRGYRRITPRLRGDPPPEPPDEDDEDGKLYAAVQAFGEKFGKIQLPEESM